MKKILQKEKKMVKNQENHTSGREGKYWEESNDPTAVKYFNCSFYLKHDITISPDSFAHL